MNSVRRISNGGSFRDAPSLIAGMASANAWRRGNLGNLYQLAARAAGQLPCWWSPAAARRSFYGLADPFVPPVNVTFCPGA